ncbi:MAG: hybrid sensor histidine kinase/response regulator [Rubrivivax sp.]|nr:MAG: hybrid sensor histidine kinase/response regulator [Rubrivivax sp.]
MTAPPRAEPSYSERVVALAPTTRDADVTNRLLAAAGIDGVVANDFRHAEALIREGAGALMVTDLTLADPGVGTLVRVLDSQPPWSNLPVLALCRQGLPALVRDNALRNVTVLDRPTSTRAMLSAVLTALRGRRWQYQIRDQIESLLQADRALRLADQRKDEFLATLAHELRNPLAPIRTGLQLLARLGDNPGRQQQLTDMMERQMTHLLHLIDDLLEVSRISTGKLVLQRERLDLRRVVDMAMEACAPMISRGGHELAVTVPEEALFVNGDLTRLSQSLCNLVNNAAKYTPDRGRIVVTLARSGHEALLTVQDNGIGLPADMINRVFDMFAQVNRSLERAQGGLGIGLALVKSLVAMHGGHVNASSPGPGQGSTFTIRLPLMLQAPPPAEPSAEAAPAPTRALRILVVDDNEDAAESLAMLLSLGGHQVRVEHGGLAGLQTAATLLPQAIFCDVGMPGMGGYEFATRLRQDARFASTLLVALTGWGSEEDKRRARAAGFDEHLTKPASVDAVSAMLAKL